MPSDECMRWLEESVKASQAKLDSDIWHLAAGYMNQKMVRGDEDHPLMRSAFFRIYLTR